MGRFKRISEVQSENDYVRFWSKVALTANQDLCWNWRATKHKKGYGNFWFNGQLMRATHISIFYKTGVLPNKGSFACHTCDNPSCVNPNHIFIGTNQDNMNDKVKKGRMSCLKGESNPKAKLTEGGVREIRYLYNSGLNYPEISTKVGVSRSMVGGIIRGKFWKHV